MLYRDIDVETEGQPVPHTLRTACSHSRASYAVPIERIVCDEETLPFEENSHDAVMSCLSLHWVNDLPGVLVVLSHVARELITGSRRYTHSNSTHTEAGRCVYRIDVWW